MQYKCLQMLRARILFCALMCAATLHGAVDLTILQQQGSISDYAGIFPVKERAVLEELLAELNNRYDVQVSLVTLPNLGETPIERATQSLYDAWDMGRGTLNKSALILLSAGDGQMHIYVGMGLRGVLSTKWIDARAAELSPLMEHHRYEDACVNAIAVVVRRIHDNASDLPKLNTVMVQSPGMAAAAVSDRKALPIAGVIALAFGALLVISTLMQAGNRQASVYDMGRDFERNRTGPFGSKKPRWL